MKCLITLLILFAGLWPAQISSDLGQRINQSTLGDTITVQIYFQTDFNPAALTNLSHCQKVAYLKTTTGQTQSAVHQRLIQKGARNIKSFWAGNLIIATISVADLEEIFQDDNVIYLDITRIYKIEEPIEADAVLGGESVEWNIEKIRADDVWQEGYTGKGINIGFIDTGVDAIHPDIKNQRREYDSWYDATTDGDSLNPYDDYGHGTHVIGTACGRNGIGVAPDAKWIIVRAFVDGGASSEDIHEAFDWLVGLNEPPQIISNSWGSGNQTRLEFWPDLETIRALGIIPVFANGNSGFLGPSTPGNFPLVIGVGATDKDDKLARFSSRGAAPNISPWNDNKYWPYPEWNRLKPDLCAPGVNVKSCFPGGGYKVWSGTSMACPHIAGVIALILEKNPILNFKEIYWLLTQNAKHFEDYGKIPNCDYGWGRVDVYQAIKNAPGYKTTERLIRPNFPNPFFRQTIIPVQLKYQMKVSLKIYDQSGRLIKILADRQLLAKGYYQFNWSGCDESGQIASAGIYFCVLRVGETQQTVKIVFLSPKRE